MRSLTADRIRMLAAKISFGRLNRDVPQKELDLLQLASRSMAEPGTGTPQIVRRQLGYADALGGFLHDVPNRLYRHPISPCPSYFVDPAEQQFALKLAVRKKCVFFPWFFMRSL